MARACPGHPRLACLHHNAVRPGSNEGGNSRPLANFNSNGGASSGGASDGGASDDGASPNGDGASPNDGGASPSDDGGASPNDDGASAPLRASDVLPRHRW